jgi:hypothetical protein
VIGGSLGLRNHDWLVAMTSSRPWEVVLPVKHPLDVGPPVFEEATGAYTFPPPPGFTAEEFDAELTRLVLEDRQREGNRIAGEPTLDERIKALRCWRLTPSQLADLAYFENPESIATEPAGRDGHWKDDPWSALNIVMWLGWVNNAGWA